MSFTIHVHQYSPHILSYIVFHFDVQAVLKNASILKVLEVI